MSQVAAVGDHNFQAEVLDSATPVLVDFFAPWCGPCHAVAPLIEELAQEYNGRLKVVKCDVDQFEALSVNYGVRKIPNLTFFKDGEVVQQIVAYTSRRQLRDVANEVLDS